MEWRLSRNGQSWSSAFSPSALRSARVEGEPLGPVPAQIEEVVKVNQTTILEVIDEARKYVLRGQWSESDQSIFNTKFLVGEIVSLIYKISV